MTIPLDSVLFLTENDTKSINRYKLNYRCLTGKVNKEQGKVDFLALAEKMYPDKKN